MPTYKIIKSTNEKFVEGSIIDLTKENAYKLKKRKQIDLEIQDETNEQIPSKRIKGDDLLEQEPANIIRQTITTLFEETPFSVMDLFTPQQQADMRKRNADKMINKLAKKAKCVKFLCDLSVFLFEELGQEKEDEVIKKWTKFCQN